MSVLVGSCCLEYLQYTLSASPVGAAVDMLAFERGVCGDADLVVAVVEEDDALESALVAAGGCEVGT